MAARLDAHPTEDAAEALSEQRALVVKLQGELDSRTKLDSQTRLTNARQRQELNEKDAIISAMRNEGLVAVARVRRRLVFWAASSCLGWLVAAALLVAPLPAVGSWRPHSIARWVIDACATETTALPCSVVRLSPEGCLEIPWLNASLAGSRWACVPADWLAVDSIPVAESEAHISAFPSLDQSTSDARMVPLISAARAALIDVVESQAALLQEAARALTAKGCVCADPAPPSPASSGPSTDRQCLGLTTQRPYSELVPQQALTNASSQADLQMPLAVPEEDEL